MSNEERELLPLERLEEQAILEALKLTGGNVAQMAELLGIGRTTLYKKMQKYGINIEGQS